jgi:hypothetical protein
MPSDTTYVWLTGVAALVMACGSRTALDVPVSVQDATSRAKPVGCSGSTAIYAISNIAPPSGLPGNGELYSFDPGTAEFKDLGVVACPSDSSFNSIPASMTVDREGTAYVAFVDGNIFRVSTRTLYCEATSFAPGQVGPDPPGLAFVANRADGGETLFLTRTDPSALVTLDQDTLAMHEVGLFSNSVLEGVQLTGTADGRLYGLFAPHEIAPPAYIVQIDPASAQVLGSFSLDSVTLGAGWAVAFWGGDFYVFIAPVGPPSVVERFRPSDGSVVQVATAPAGVLIAGAGVSTCAPLR